MAGPIRAVRRHQDNEIAARSCPFFSAAARLVAMGAHTAAGCRRSGKPPTLIPASAFGQADSGSVDWLASRPEFFPRVRQARKSVTRNSRAPRCRFSGELSNRLNVIIWRVYFPGPAGEPAERFGELGLRLSVGRSMLRPTWKVSSSVTPVSRR